MKKKTFILGLIGSLTILSCSNKDKESSKISVSTSVSNENGKIDSTYSVTENVNGNKTKIKSATYIGLDGSRAQVTTEDKGNDGTIVIQANGQKFQLDKKNSSATVTSYERNGVRAVIKGDSVIITQGKVVIPLVKDK